MHRHRVAAAVALLTGAAFIAAPAAAHADASSTFHVDSGVTCSDTTADSSATPFCTIQAAVNAAANPGDTVIVAGGTYAPFTVTASGTADAPITIEGATTAYGSLNAFVSTPQGGSVVGATISGAAYITLKGLKLYSYGNASAVAVSGADHVTLDTVIAVQAAKASAAAIAVSSSSYLSVVHSFVGGTTTAATVAINGGSNDTLASDYVQNGKLGPGIMIDDSAAAAVAGNTVMSTCGTGIGALDGSASSSIENNVVEGLGEAGFGTCAVPVADEGGVVVDTASTAGTTTDYNVVDTEQASIPDYSWSGANYPTASAFEGVTGQAAHDVNSTAVTGAASVTIDSANADAPGESATALDGEPRVDDRSVADTGAGAATYYDRGAREWGDPITASVSNWPTKAPVDTAATFSKTLTDPWSNTVTGCAFTFSDTTRSVQVAPVNGTCTTTHSFAVTGNDTAGLTVSLSDGYTVYSSSSVNVVAAVPFVPALSVTASGTRAVDADTVGTTDSWNVVSCTFDYGDGTVVTTGLNGANDCDHSYTYATPGTYKVTVTQTDAGGNQASNSTSFSTVGSYFTPVAPVRVLDTRHAIGVATGKVAANGTVKLKIAGVAGVPADVTAVSLNVTVTNPAKAGFATVYPSGQPLPNASTVNYGPGQTRANTVVAQVGADGHVDLTNSSAGATDLVADLDGYYTKTDASGYTTIAPIRVMDTRVAKTTIPAGGTVKVNPGSYAGITAATMNVTVTAPTSGGFISAYPDGTSKPNSSNVNYGPGQTIANGAVVEVGQDGYVDFTNNSTGSTELVVDLTGYFTAGTGAAFTPIVPTRFLDTRIHFGDMQGGVGLFSPGRTGNLYIENAGICPGGETSCVDGNAVWGGATAIAANITVTQPTSIGFISVYPNDETTAPSTSVVNFAAGQTTANATTVGLGAAPDDGIYIYNASKGATQLVVDVFGYYG